MSELRVPDKDKLAKRYHPLIHRTVASEIRMPLIGGMLDEYRAVTTDRIFEPARLFGPKNSNDGTLDWKSIKWIGDNTNRSQEHPEHWFPDVETLAVFHSRLEDHGWPVLTTYEGWMTYLSTQLMRYYDERIDKTRQVRLNPEFEMMKGYVLPALFACIAAHRVYRRDMEPLVNWNYHLTQQTVSTGVNPRCYFAAEYTHLVAQYNGKLTFSSFLFARDWIAKMFDFVELLAETVKAVRLYEVEKYVDIGEFAAHDKLNKWLELLDKFENSGVVREGQMLEDKRRVWLLTNSGAILKNAESSAQRFFRSGIDSATHKTSLVVARSTVEDTTTPKGHGHLDVALQMSFRDRMRWAMVPSKFNWNALAETNLRHFNKEDLGEYVTFVRMDRYAWDEMTKNRTEETERQMFYTLSIYLMEWWRWWRAWDYARRDLLYIEVEHFRSYDKMLPIELKYIDDADGLRDEHMREEGVFAARGLEDMRRQQHKAESEFERDTKQPDEDYEKRCMKGPHEFFYGKLSQKEDQRCEDSGKEAETQVGGKSAKRRRDTEGAASASSSSSSSSGTQTKGQKGRGRKRTNACLLCKQIGAAVQCGSCRVAHYCSERCRGLDADAGHAAICGELAALGPEKSRDYPHRVVALRVKQRSLANSC